MDCNSYHKLPAAEKAHLWSQLKETPGWQVLVGMKLQAMAAKPKVTSLDSREAFYFAAAVEQGMHDVLNTPDEQLKAIQ